jgi:hypothetical protein
MFKMEISNSTMEDIDEIFRLYRLAVVYQKMKNAVCWPEFEHSLVEKEINEKNQWKIVAGNTIACVPCRTR